MRLCSKSTLKCCVSHFSMYVFWKSRHPFDVLPLQIERKQRQIYARDGQRHPQHRMPAHRYHRHNGGHKHGLSNRQYAPEDESTTVLRKMPKIHRVGHAGTNSRHAQQRIITTPFSSYPPPMTTPSAATSNSLRFPQEHQRAVASLRDHTVDDHGTHVLHRGQSGYVCA